MPATVTGAKNAKTNSSYCLQGTHSLMQATAISTSVHNPVWQVLY